MESLRQELSASTAAYERLRVEAARETTKLKHRLSAALTGAPGQGLGPASAAGQGLGPGDRLTDEKLGLASASASAPGQGLGGGRVKVVRPPPPGEDREGVLIRRIATLERDLAMMTRQTTTTHNGRQTRASSKNSTPTPTSIASVFSSTTMAGGRGVGRGGVGVGGGGSLSRPARSTTPPVQRGRGTPPTSSSSVYGSGGSRGSVGGGTGGSGGRVPPRHLSPSPTAMARTNIHTYNNHGQGR